MKIGSLGATLGLLVLVGCAADDSGFEDEPVVTRFSAFPATIGPGGGYTKLQWDVEGADVVTILPGVGDVTGRSIEVPVTASTDSTILATNWAGTVMKTVSVRVGKVGPVIRRFRADPTTLPPGGGDVRLSWAIDDGHFGALTPEVWRSDGYRKIMATVYETTTFYLTATDELGRDAVEALTVTVEPPVAD